MKSVYLLKNLESGFYKIGTSKNPSVRIKQLQTGSSGKLVLVKNQHCVYSTKVEAYLHQVCKHLNVSGEWFDLDESFIDSFCESCIKSDNNFKFIFENSTLYKNCNI